ncbi:MAG TPA: hypothetical protein VKT33_14945 [Candidatus Angelobacter sp.]|nr:hypothetical protein [Candidatus Angelobacter sp.]
MTKTPLLEQALHKKQLVKFTRSFDEGSVNGYILDIGPKFFLIALVEDASRFNGFQCIRVSDVRNLHAPDKNSLFVETALKKLNRKMPSKPRLKLETVATILASANAVFPLVTIHREQADPGICHIGLVKDVNRTHVSLLEIGMDASWDKRPTEHKLSEITRIDFGGNYEEALHLVGGIPD